MPLRRALFLPRLALPCSLHWSFALSFALLLGGVLLYCSAPPLPWTFRRAYTAPEERRAERSSKADTGTRTGHRGCSRLAPVADPKACAHGTGKSRKRHPARSAGHDPAHRDTERGAERHGNGAAHQSSTGRFGGNFPATSASDFAGNAGAVRSRFAENGEAFGDGFAGNEGASGSGFAGSGFAENEGAVGDGFAGNEGEFGSGFF